MMFRIWLSPPHTCGKELEFIQDAFDKNWIAPMGDNIDGFEQDVVDYIGGDVNAVALNTGTAALHLALILLGVKRDDYVICQGLTFSATINPVVYLGATPVFVDSELETWNLSPYFLRKAIEDCIRKNKRPKAIIWVNLYGMPAQIDEIKSIADEYGIVLLEDAAESLGSAYRGRKCGAFGDVSAISFNGNKIITTSNGGMLLSKKKESVEKALFLATQARDPFPYYQHSHIGYNYRMSNISAGIGRGQMTVLQDRVNARRANNAFYQQAFAGMPGIKVHKEPNSDFYSNHWLSCILVDPAQTGGVSREDIRLKLRESGIESRPLWKPMHLQPVFEDCVFYGDGTSEKLFEQGLCLPSGSNLKPEELEEVKGVVLGMF